MTVDLLTENEMPHFLMINVMFTNIGKYNRIDFVSFFYHE